MVNLHKQGHKEDPFILASQAKQDFYVTNPSDKRMSVVILPSSRYAIEDCEDESMENEECSYKRSQIEYDDAGESSIYTRNDHDEGLWVDKDKNEGSSHKRHCV